MMKQKTPTGEKRIEMQPGDGFELAQQWITDTTRETNEAIAVYNEQSFTIPELAAELGKSVTVIRRYIAAGLFPNAYKDGPFTSSKYRVPKRDIDSYKAAMIQSKRAAADGDTADGK